MPKHPKRPRIPPSCRSSSSIFVVHRIPMIAVDFVLSTSADQRDKRSNRPNLPIRVAARSDDGGTGGAFTADGGYMAN